MNVQSIVNNDALGTMLMVENVGIIQIAHQKIDPEAARIAAWQHSRVQYVTGIKAPVLVDLDGMISPLNMGVMPMLHDLGFTLYTVFRTPTRLVITFSDTDKIVSLKPALYPDGISSNILTTAYYRAEALTQAVIYSEPALMGSIAEVMQFGWINRNDNQPRSVGLPPMMGSNTQPIPATLGSKAVWGREDVEVAFNNLHHRYFHSSFSAMMQEALNKRQAQKDEQEKKLKMEPLGKGIRSEACKFVIQRDPNKTGIMDIYDRFAFGQLSVVTAGPEDMKLVEAELNKLESLTLEGKNTLFFHAGNFVIGPNTTLRLEDVTLDTKDKVLKLTGECVLNNIHLNGGIYENIEMIR